MPNHDASEFTDGPDPASAVNGAEPLSLRVSSDGDCVTVALAGELDLATTPEFERELDGLVQSRVQRLLLDLRGVSFMDSTGLAAIGRAHQLADAQGWELMLRRGPDQVQRLFRLTGLEDRLTFTDG